MLGIALLLVTMTAAIFACTGTGERGVRTVIRATARSSLAIFLLTFTASSLRRLVAIPATAWLLRNRRYLGVSLAISQALHLAAIAWVFARWPHPFLEQSATRATLIGGGLSYLLVAAMTVTSFDGPARWLGPRRWRMLHLAGSYLLYFIFAQSYVGRVLRGDWTYLPLVLALIAALLLRIGARLRKRRGSASAS